MATTSFTIYSRYDPETDKDRLQRETGQLVDDATECDTEHLWREAASAQFLRTHRPPPKFIPAIISGETFGSEGGPSKPRTQNRVFGSSLSSWYRSVITTPDDDTIPRPTLTSTPCDSVTSKEPPISTEHRKNNKDWFIQKVLPTEAPRVRPPSLADILAREPPPLPSQPKYTPPVWIEIGPSNKGFVMLQRGGWREGEALGPDAAWRRSSQLISSSSDATPFLSKGKQKLHVVEQVPQTLKQETQVEVGGSNRVDIIDLTLSDSDSSPEDSSPEDEETTEDILGLHQTLEAGPPKFPEGTSDHGGKALLTPLATVLKLDRLGIGLKAKTVGPYKASVKRVTHNAAALAAHIRAAEEARRRRERFGRGRRGYERQRRKDETKRRDLLAYMNT